MHNWKGVKTKMRTLENHANHYFPSKKKASRSILTDKRDTNRTFCVPPYRWLVVESAYKIRFLKGSYSITNFWKKQESKNKVKLFCDSGWCHKLNHPIRNHGKSRETQSISFAAGRKM